MLEMTLVVLDGTSAGREIPVSEPSFCIGRAPECQLRLHNDLISRRHCLITLREQYAAVEDLNSKNGTFINDHRVHSQQKLQSGDRLRVGPLRLEVRLVRDTDVPSPGVPTAIASPTSLNNALEWPAEEADDSKETTPTEAGELSWEVLRKLKSAESCSEQEEREDQTKDRPIKEEGKIGPESSGNPPLKPSSEEEGSPTVVTDMFPKNPPCNNEKT